MVIANIVEAKDVSASSVRCSIKETLEASFALTNKVRVNSCLSQRNGVLPAKSIIRYNDVAAYTTYGTDLASAYYWTSGKAEG